MSNFHAKCKVSKIKFMEGIKPIVNRRRGKTNSVFEKREVCGKLKKNHPVTTVACHECNENTIKFVP